MIIAFARAALVLILLAFGIAHLRRPSLQAGLRLGGSVHARAGRLETRRVRAASVRNRLR